MLRVCVGSSNPSKIRGVEEAFKALVGDVHVEGYPVKGFIDQPMGLKNIVDLARYRAKKVMEIDSGCDFYVGVEAGFIEVEGVGYFDIHVACIVDKDGNEFYGFSPAFLIPMKFVKKILSGEFKELEQVVDLYFGTKEIGEKGGFISVLTRGIIERSDLVYYSVATALIPIINRHLYASD